LRYTYISGIKKLTKKLSYGISTLVLVGMSLGSALPALFSPTAYAVGYTYPSTNQANKTAGHGYVEQTAANDNSVTLAFHNPDPYYMCFEYRTDGDASQKLAENSGNNYNTGVIDGLYPYFCLNNSTETHTISANGYVEVRSTFGAERDTDFDWTKFVVTPVCTSATDGNFENGTIASVNAQNGWTSTGNYDQSIVDNTYGLNSLGCKTLRISNAVTSGAFGNQTFSYATTSAGESSTGATKDVFSASFDIASTKSAVQPGMALSVSPDDGYGNRISYLRFEDQTDSIHVYFDDATDAGPLGTSAVFNETEVATLTRTEVHNVKFVINYKNGPSNDVVNVYIDGTQVHSGTTWEDYYRYDTEQSGNGNVVPKTERLLFRAAGTAVPANNGNGFLFDNVSITSSSSNAAPTLTVTTPAEGSIVSTAITGDELVIKGAFTDDVKANYASFVLVNLDNGHYYPSGIVYGTGIDVHGNYTYSMPGTDNLPDGDYLLVYTGTDFQGGSTGSQERRFTVDNTAPTFAISNPSDGEIVSGDVEVRAEVADANGIKKLLMTVPTKAGNKTYVWEQGKTNNSLTKNGSIFSVAIDTTTLYDGPVYVVLRATDSAGNTRYWNNNAAHREHSFTVDNTAPTVSIDSPADGAVLQGPVDVKGSVNDANPHHYWVQIKKDGTVIYSQTTNDSTSFSDKVLRTLTDEGVYEVTLAARDAAGGTSTSGNRSANVVVTFTIDNTAPVAAIDAYTGTDTTPTLTGTVDDPTAVLTVAIDGGSAMAATNNGDGTWSFDIISALSVGSHTVVLIATDTAGNSYQATANVTVQAPHASLTGRTASQGSGNSDQATGQQPVVTVTPNNDGQVLGASTDNSATETKDDTVNLASSNQKAECRQIRCLSGSRLVVASSHGRSSRRILCPAVPPCRQQRLKLRLTAESIVPALNRHYFLSSATLGL